MPIRINKVFLEPDRNSGPKDFCELCNLYKVWRNSSWVCEQCGSLGTAEDVIGKTKKILKADMPQPLIASKRTVKAKEDIFLKDFPAGAMNIDDEIV